MRFISSLVALTTFAALAGCAGDAPVIVAPATVSHRPAPPPPATSTPAFQAIGSDARTLIAQFGTPAIDQREGPARKLQFRGAACVLDAYLYPPANGGAPRVTWIDTRNSQGNDMDRAACITALTRH
jgi:predicted small lipoprotein YifL